VRKLLEKWFHGYRVASRFFVDLDGFRRKIAFVLVLSLVLAGFEVLRPLTIKWVIDYAFKGKSIKLHIGDFTLFKHHIEPVGIVWMSGATLVLIAVGGAFLAFVMESVLSTVSSGVARAMRYRLFTHMTRLSPGFHARHKSGDLLVRLMGDASIVTGMLVDTPLEVVQRSLIVIGVVATMILIDPWLTLGMGASIPVLLLIVRFFSSGIRTTTRKAREKEGDLADYLHEAIAATETIQSMGSGDLVVRRFARSNRTTARAEVKADQAAARMSGLVESTLGLTVAGVLVLASFRVLQAIQLANAAKVPGMPDPDPADFGMSIGTFTAFFSYARTLLKPLRTTSKNAARFSKGTACGERILAVLDATDVIASVPGAPPAPEVPSELAFVDVGYSYKEGIDALTGFSASFRRGELSALVGRSGAGKSTIAALSLRLFDPRSGEVSLDGRSLRDYDLASLRSRMGLAQQRTVFFGESIRENMLLASPEATDEQIWSALEQAGAAEFVNGLPEKLEAKLGSNGVGLSGGQQSRLSLARTLLRRAPVLICDEPFAGLDLAAAKRVADTLLRLAQERILVVIAHDLERLDAYDHIVFLENGRKIAEGRHQDLLRDVPLYREVVRTSAGVRA
jgi:ATP-binding cassette subfamily B protein